MDKQTRIQMALERMRSFYVAKTGLGRLSDWDIDTSIAPNGVESCRNENGILYRMLALIQMIRAKATLSIEDKLLLQYALIGLRRFPDQPGFYNRQPHGDKPITRLEAHDNYIGALLAAWYLGLNVPEANGAIRHFWRNRFCFNNVEPGKFSWRSFRQPGEVALYYMAAERRAPFLFTLWFLGGVMVSAFKEYKHGEASRLTFMRLFLIDQVGVKGFVQRWLYGKVRNFWFKKLKEKFGGNGITPIMLEYDKNHPVHQFELLVDYSGT